MKRTLFAFVAIVAFAFSALAQEIPLPQPKPDIESHAVRFVNYQDGTERLMSKFKGTAVVGSDGKLIGRVSDLLIDDSGNITAYIVAVGGFLGIGEKDVGITPDSFDIIPGDSSTNESDKLRLDMTLQEMRVASNLEPYKAPVTTAPARTSPKMRGMTPTELFAKVVPFIICFGVGFILFSGLFWGFSHRKKSGLCEKMTTDERGTLFMGLTGALIGVVVFVFYL